jgi:general stress protein CsbA
MSENTLWAIVVSVVLIALFSVLGYEKYVNSKVEIAKYQFKSDSLKIVGGK